MPIKDAYNFVKSYIQNVTVIDLIKSFLVVLGVIELIKVVINYVTDCIAF